MDLPLLQEMDAKSWDLDCEEGVGGGGHETHVGKHLVDALNGLLPIQAPQNILQDKTACERSMSTRDLH